MRSGLLLLIFGVSGMTALIYEITWIRPLSLVFGTTLYSVTTIVASFILGLGIGSWLAGKYTDRMKNPLKYFAITQILIGAYGILLLLIFPHLPDFYVNIYYATLPNYELFLSLQVVFTILLLLIPTVLMGSTLPFLLKTYSTDIKKIGQSVGKLDGSNSFGAMIGVLSAGFFMIPFLGIQLTIIVTAFINFTMGFAILIYQKKVRKAVIIPVVIVVILILIAFPSYNIDVLNSAVYISKPAMSLLTITDLQKDYKETLYYDESAYSSILVEHTDPNIQVVKLNEDTNVRLIQHEGINLKINGKIQCSNNEKSVEGLSNLANIPLELYSSNFGTATNALNVGLGCGTTSFELGNKLPTTTIEIDPSIVKASEIFYDDIQHELIIDDARNWLIRNSETFDIIVTEPSDPYINNSILFTKEYFEVLYDSTTENGLVAQWIPVYLLTNYDFYIMYNTFHTVFPYVYGYEMELGSEQQLILIGSKVALTDYENNLFMFDHSTIKKLDTEINTDDKPILEFNVSKHLFDVNFNRDIGFIDYLDNR